jgi:hypothetical protein
MLHALPSLHGAVLLLWLHLPLVASQLSLVHGLLSSQLAAVPGKHWPPLHTSPKVQALPSSHIAVLA